MYLITRIIAHDILGGCKTGNNNNNNTKKRCEIGAHVARIRFPRGPCDPFEYSKRAIKVVKST